MTATFGVVKDSYAHHPQPFFQLGFLWGITQRTTPQCGRVHHVIGRSLFVIIT